MMHKPSDTVNYTYGSVAGNGTNQNTIMAICRIIRYLNCSTMRIQPSSAPFSALTEVPVLGSIGENNTEKEGILKTESKARPSGIQGNSIN